MVNDLINKYINQVNIMQLATCLNNQPWVVTVHFYADEYSNLYWSSRSDRRHSQELLENPNTSATILIHENTEQEDWVIGLTFSGKSMQLANLDTEISSKYVSKLLKDPKLPENIASGSDPAKWYKLTPTKIILFDNKHFPTDPRQEIIINS